MTFEHEDNKMIQPDALLDLLLPLEVDAEKLLGPRLHEAIRPAGSGVGAGRVDEIISVI